MPNGGIEIAFILPDNAHAQVGDEIIGNAGEDAVKNIRGIAESLGFKQGFSHQAVGIDVFRVKFKDISAMRESFIDLILIDHYLYITTVGT
jgi:hypothetical protein